MPRFRTDTLQEDIHLAIGEFAHATVEPPGGPGDFLPRQILRDRLGSLLAISHRPHRHLSPANRVTTSKNPIGPRRVSHAVDLDLLRRLHLQCLGIAWLQFPDRDKHRIKLLANRLHGDGNPHANAQSKPHAELLNLGDFTRQHVTRQLRLGDTVAEHPTGLVVFVDDNAFETIALQVIGSRQPGRTGSDDGHALALGLGTLGQIRRLRSQIHIRDVTFQQAN